MLELRDTYQRSLLWTVPILVRQMFPARIAGRAKMEKQRIRRTVFVSDLEYVYI